MSKVAKQIKHKVCEAMQALIKPTNDGKRVVVSFTLPLVIDILIRKGYTIPFEVCRIASADRLVAIFMRGLRRLVVDGAKASYQKKDPVTGEIVTIRLNEKEIQADAIANAENNIAYLYGIREKSISVDPVTLEARAILCRWIIRNCEMDTGARYTENRIPAFARNAKTIAEVERAAEQFGVSAKGIKNLVIKARHNVENLDRDFEDTPEEVAS